MHRDLGTGFWWHLPAGVLVAGLFGLLLGIPSLRLRRRFLAITASAFQAIIYLGLSQWTCFTGGQYGLSVPAVGAVPVFGLQVARVADVQAFYWPALLVAAACLFFARRLARSRLGREWIAIRGDETLARAIGLDATGGKLIAFVASAAARPGRAARRRRHRQVHHAARHRRPPAAAGGRDPAARRAHERRGG